MDKPLLNDPGEYPDDLVLEKYLKNKKIIWDEFVTQVDQKFTDITFNWRYYNDGHAWLCKVCSKKKTVCWISVWDGFYKTVFYFPRSKGEILESQPFLAEIDSKYYEIKPVGKSNAYIFEHKAKKILPGVYKVFEFKMNFK